jgi:hypothetical protein
LLFLSFPILRSEFYRYRQNPNGIIKHLFQFEPSKAAILSAITELLVGSFEINPAWPFGQREGHNSGHRRMVNSFLKKKFQTFCLNSFDTEGGWQAVAGYGR